MPIDTFKPRGPSKLSSPESGGASTKPYPIVGIVKDNIDPSRSGRIRVALQDGKGPVDSNDASNWVTVQHLTTFFGVVRPNAGKDSENFGSYVDNSSSYGQWQAPPDIGTKVVCIFIGGDTSAGFYIGAIPEPETLQMVPAIGATDVVTVNEGEAESFGGATRLPVTNLNTNNKDKANSDEFLNTPRPVHSYTASIMNQQGIIRDPIRGPISSSASREAASRVGWGVNTPGRPIYEGGYTDENLPENLDQSKAEQLKVVARRGGHSIVMDDGDIIGRDQLIRIRTSLGHQILMSDDGQTLMILHSNGQSYIELGKEGTVDIFSTNSINMRTQGDFNIHADRDINMHAAENFNLQAKNIHTNSEEVTKSRAGKEYAITALNNFMVKASSAAAISAGGQASMVAGAEAFVNGSKVNLNSGNASLTPEEVPIIPINAQPDTLYDKTVGWAAAPAKLLSIASRAPAHYPWVNAGLGVDIKNSPDADDNLPEPPSPAVQQVNKEAEATNAKPPEVATVSSVPQVPSVSETLDKGTTDAVLAATATSAAEGESSEAVEAGAGIVKKSGGSLISGINSALNVAAGLAATAGGVISAANQAAVAVGSFAQNAQQLSKAGVLKPGAENLVNGLASAGKTLVNAMPASVFAGTPGAESVEQLATNTPAQATSMVNVMKKSQQQLTDSGVINGSESTTQTAGLIAAASTVGTDAVIEVVKQTATVTDAIDSLATASTEITNAARLLGVSTTSPLQSATNLLSTAQQTTAALASITSGAQSVIGAIGTGISAAKLSQNLGGLGGISNSLKALSDTGASLTGLLDSVKGVSGSAFSAIKDSFGKLEPNKPQYLTDSAKQTASITAIAENATSSQLSSSKSLSSLVSGITTTANDIAKLSNDFNNTVNSITGIPKNVAGAFTTPGTINSGTINNTLVNATNQFSTAVGSIANTVTNISDTVNNLESSAQQVTALINSTTGAGVNKLADSISGAFDNINSMAGASTSLKNGKAGLVNAAKKTQAGGLAAKASQLSSGVSNLPGGVKAFSSVTDKKDVAVNKIPGTEQLTGIMNDLQTEVTKGIGKAGSTLTSVSSAIGQIESAAGTLGLSNISSIAGKAGGLTSSIASKLPIGQATQLLSAVSALGAGGASPIKLPSLGINTSERSSITSQTKSILGNPKIPEPNLLGDIKDETIDNLTNKLREATKRRTALQKEFKKLNAEFEAAEKDFYEKLNTLPEGDPVLEAAFAKYKQAANNLAPIVEDLINIQKEADAAITAGLRNTPGGRLFGI
jgi:hypothetical protein